MKHLRYLGLAALFLVLAALTPETPPADAVDSWDVALSELMDVGPPGIVLEAPVATGNQSFAESFAYFEMNSSFALSLDADRPEGNQAIESTMLGDCRAFMRGSERPRAGGVGFERIQALPSSFGMPEKIVD